MDNALLDEVLTEYYEREFSKYTEVPKHKFSLKHRLAMKRIFKLYEKNTECYRRKTVRNIPAKPKEKLKLKTALVVVMIVFLGAFLGCTAVYFISQNFKGDVHNEFTNIFPIDAQNCPTTIEEKYYISELPEGFKLFEEDSTLYDLYIKYKNTETGQTITFSQIVKSEYSTQHLNTERHDLEEIEINGKFGILLDLSDDKRTKTLVLWDNGNYILEITADLHKNEIINLAKNTKVFKK